MNETCDDRVYIRISTPEIPPSISQNLLFPYHTWEPRVLNDLTKFLLDDRYGKHELSFKEIPP